MNEKELIRKAKDGNEEAIIELFNNTENMIYSIVNIIKCRNKEDYQDLVSAGKLGFFDALSNYDTTINCKFSTYAYYWIKRRVFLAFNQNDFASNASSRTAYIYPKMVKIMNEYRSKYNKDIPYEELLEELKPNRISRRNLNQLLVLYENKTPSSIEDIELIDTNNISIEDEIIHNEQIDILYNSLDVLTEIEKDCVVKKFGLGGIDPVSYKDIADTYNKSAEWARLKTKDGLNKIKNYIEE